MTILEAYNKNLIKVGRRIITNGNGKRADSDGGKIKVKGTITTIRKTHLSVRGTVYLEKYKKQEFYSGWDITLDNEEAYIIFIKGISPYAYWVKGIEK
jgi:hypothetical protein